MLYGSNSERERSEHGDGRFELAMGIAVVFLVLFGIAGFQWWRAEKHREFAEQEAAVARHRTALATSRGLAAEAQNYLNKQLDLALLLSVEASRKAKTAEARQALYTTLDAAGSSIFLHGYWDELRKLAFSPDGQRLASVTERHYCSGICRCLTLSPLLSSSTRVACRHSRSAPMVKPSPRGPGTLLLWDLSAPPPRSRLFSGYQEPVRAFAFSPDSKMLASGDQEGTLLLLNMSVTPPMSILSSHTINVMQGH